MGLDVWASHRAYIFCRIVTDHSRKVREAALTAMGVLAAKVKRALAPHLKTLLGWVLAPFIYVCISCCLIKLESQMF